MANTLTVDAKQHVTISGMSPPVAPGVRPSKDGAEIFTVDFGENFDPQVNIEGNFAFEIAFDHAGVLRNLAVLPILRQLRDTVAIGVVKKGFFPHFEG